MYIRLRAPKQHAAKAAAQTRDTTVVILPRGNQVLLPSCFNPSTHVCHALTYTTLFENFHQWYCTPLMQKQHCWMSVM